MIVLYEVTFDKDAVDFLSNLPIDIKQRIFNKVIAAKESPLHFFERLAGRSDYKLRVGDYRVIADIDQADKKITITLVGHRKNVYDN